MLAGFITVFAVVNIFTPVLFTVDSQCVYRALLLRSVMLACQILLLLLIAIYAVVSMFRSHAEKRGKYRTLALFGLLMAVLLFLQIWFPLLPLYIIAYMLGTCLLHTFVVNEEKAAFKRGLEEAAKDKQHKSTIESLLNNLPGMTFTKDAGTGAYLAILWANMTSLPLFARFFLVIFTMLLNNFLGDSRHGQGGRKENPDHRADGQRL
ncbi:MAG: hypothetical protein K6G66_10085 [Oscillospiraceae bacterium]|nr:hypothetical protein [Oscillospiraceae bacterium]